MTKPTTATTQVEAADTEQPFTRLSPAEATELAVTVYELPPPSSVVRLQTERDDTFRLEFAGAPSLVLKVAHPAENPMVVNLQTAALAHASAADPRLPLQRQIPARDGSLEPTVRVGDGVERLARLLTYLPGRELRQLRRSVDQLRACGRIQARLAAALEDFSHPAANRHLAFDLRHFGELRNIRASSGGSLIDRVFAWHDQVLVPAAPDLPLQVLHSDFGLDNVLVDPAADEFVVGILDWGDVVCTWRVADLASGLASLVAETGDAWEAPAELLAGYLEVMPLEPTETAMLRGLVAMRIAQRILMAERLSAARPENAGYLRRNLPASYRQLDNLYA